MARVFGKYEKIRRIAQGGMGEVFLARQTGVLDRLAILKSLRADLAQEREFVDQFLDEARVAATLNHPNIVSIYDVGEWNGTYYIAMEYVPGEDLSKLWYAAAKAGVGLPFQVSVRICYEAALGLDHAHKAKDMRGLPLNIVHRDVSPQNIMVRGDGVVKLVDFGIAKAANKSSRTQAGMVKGKLQYMSPEQVRGEALDGRSDQFSLGVVLWEMCTGRRLFKADSEINTLQKILQAPIPKPSEHVPGFPAELEATILRMLQRDAEKRFKNLGEAAAELKGYLDRSALAGGETSVAAFVQQILGKELDERIADLTPMEPTEAGAPLPTKRPERPPSKERRAAQQPAQPSIGASGVDEKPENTDPLTESVAPNERPTLVMPEEAVDKVPKKGAGGLQLRKPDGRVVAFADQAALHQAILDGSATADDTFATDGRTWKRLGDVPALTKFLEIAAAASAVSSSKRGHAPGVPQPPSQNTVTKPIAPVDPNNPQTMALSLGPGERTDPMTGQFSLGDLPQSLTGTWGAPEIAKAVAKAKAENGEALAAASSTSPTAEVVESPTLENARRPTRVPTFVWMLGGIVVALALVVGALAGFAPDMLVRLVGNKPVGNDEVVKAIQASRTDDPQAIDALLKVLDVAAAKETATSDHAAAAAVLHLARARQDDQTARLVKIVEGLGAQAPAVPAFDAEAHRASAYKLATRAQTLDKSSSGGEAAGPLLALALYQAERGAGAELETEAARALSSSKDGPLAALVEAELTTSRALMKGRADLDAVSGAGASEKDIPIARAAADTLGAVDDVRAKSLARVARARAASLASGDELKALLDAVRADAKALPDDGGDARAQVLTAVVRALGKKAETPPPPAIVDAGPPPPPAVVDAGPPPEPETYESAMEKANKAKKSERAREVAKWSRKALELKPGDVPAQLLLGFAFIDTGSNENAERQFRVILKKEPENCDAQIGVALAIDGQGKTEDARKEYQRYLEICPDGKDVGDAKAAISRLE